MSMLRLELADYTYELVRSVVNVGEVRVTRQVRFVICEYLVSHVSTLGR